MSQTTLSLSFTDAQAAAIDTALTELETQFSALVGMPADKRRKLMKMGDKSEAFCRQTLSLLEQNPQVVTPGLGLPEVQRTFDAFDWLRPRVQRLQRLGERLDNTNTVVGADIMKASLQGYALLRVSGRNQGLDGLRETLGARFARRTKSAEPKAA
jgi:hypothetical protein